MAAYRKLDRRRDDLCEGGSFAKDGAQSLAIKLETESIFHRKLRDLCLSIFLVWRPEAFQFVLVNSAVLPFANLQFVLDSARKRLHIAPLNVQWNMLLFGLRFESFAHRPQVRFAF